jgi:two-component system cell cycle sensor histidine kinase/response regulator CckA
MGISGTGLGMAVVWATVQAHYGFIDIKSTLDEGTTFYLYFPFTREAATGGKKRVPVSKTMGNGQLVKKPYTIETIGLAIKKELDN